MGNIFCPGDIGLHDAAIENLNDKEINETASKLTDKAFERFDADHDGKINMKDADDLLDDMAGQILNDLKEAQEKHDMHENLPCKDDIKKKLFNEFDQNHDGTLSNWEIKAGFVKIIKAFQQTHGPSAKEKGKIHDTFFLFLIV